MYTQIQNFLDAAWEEYSDQCDKNYRNFPQIEKNEIEDRRRNGHLEEFVFHDNYPNNRSRREKNVLQLHDRSTQLEPGRNFMFLRYSNGFGEIYSNIQEFKTLFLPYDYCLRGSGLVSMEDGNSKLVRDIVVGDRVKTSIERNLTTAIVIARTINKLENRSKERGSFEFAEVNGAWVTPDHPVYVNLRWIRPRDFFSVIEIEEEMEVYNFILSSRSSLFVNEVEVCSLGQFCEGVDDMSSFFGSERVVDHLKNDPFWPNIIL